MTTLCKQGHEDLTEGDHRPELCPWPNCPHGARGDHTNTYWTVWGPTDPVSWGKKPESFKPNEQHVKHWRREQGWRPNGQEMWRWVTG